jgi:hypothetical protein
MSMITTYKSTSFLNEVTPSFERNATMWSSILPMTWDRESMCVQGWTRLVHRRRGMARSNSETTTITTNEFRSTVQLPVEIPRQWFTFLLLESDLFHHIPLSKWTGAVCCTTCTWWPTRSTSKRLLVCKNNDNDKRDGIKQNNHKVEVPHRSRAGELDRRYRVVHCDSLLPYWSSFPSTLSYHSTRSN